MLKFLKSSFMTGLLILLPLLLLFFVLKELIELLVVFATPIADLFPENTFDTENETEILAALLIISAALTLGILAKIPASRAAGIFVADKTVNKLPFYRMLRTLTGALLEIEDTSAFKPALIQNDSGEAEPAYIIEDNGAPHLVMLVPWSPTAFAGSIKLVPRERVRALSISLNDFSLVLSNYGLGMSEIAHANQDDLKAN